MRSFFEAGHWKTLLLAGLLALVASLAIACGDDDDSGSSSGAASDQPTSAASAEATTADPALSGSLIVFAAASLTDAFTEIGEAFKAANPEVDVEFSFLGSSALRTQIEEGAPADVFASANTAQMQPLVDAGLAGEPTIFVHNSLIVIAPSDNPAGLNTLADLKNSGLKLVLAAEEVPVGGYARDMLLNAEADPAYGAGFSEAVLANLVSNEANVKQVVAKVQLGEADAGVVYGSDVTPSVAPDLHTVEVPDAINVIADYPIATLTDAGNTEVAQAFVDFVLGTAGQTILAKWGFSGV
jgi:molybdate transport system substrate-binding protein